LFGWFYYSTFETALGPFSVSVNEAGATVATAFGGLQELQSRCERAAFIQESERTAEAREQIASYLAGNHGDFDLPLAPQGSQFQQRVWQALRAIPRGQTRSYGALAKELGSSARAVGRANATNPICLIVPCHRVIGTDGSLTGFAFGEAIKRQLLELEGVRISESTEALLL
jgi:methylated-DNA-[protein]-cysteine S-methyltransferase